MPLSVLALIVASVSLSAAAQLLLKLGVTSARAVEASSPLRAALATLLQPGVLGGLALYGAGMVLWLAVLSRAELSQAYPFVGLGFVLTALAGAIVLHEPMGASRVMGTLLILAGVVLVARS